MEKKFEFMAQGSVNYGSSREALIKSGLGFAIGFILAKGLHLEDADAKAGEVYRGAAKAALREQGEDRKTADRHVNRATRDIAPNLVQRLDMSQIETINAGRLVDSLAAQFKAEGANNISAVVRILKGEAVSDPDGTEKTPEQEAAEAQAKAQSAQEAIDENLVNLALAEGAVARGETVGPETEAEAETKAAPVSEAVADVVARFGFEEVKAALLAMESEALRHVA